MEALSSAIAIAANAVIRRSVAKLVGDIAEDLAILIERQEARAVAVIDFNGVNVLPAPLGNIDVRNAAVRSFAINGVFNAAGKILVTNGLRTPILGDLLSAIREFTLVEDRTIGK